MTDKIDTGSRRCRFQWLYDLTMLLMPVGLSGIGIISADSPLGNVSFGDVLIIPLFLLQLLEYAGRRRVSPAEKYINERYMLFAAVFLLLPVLSLWNVIRFDGSLRTSGMSILKLAVCLLYGFVYIRYCSAASREQWKHFVKVGAVAGMIFSLSCIAGMLLYFAVGANPFVDAYATTFRATGFQEDPNLAAIFQLMSFSYVLMWYRFTKRKLGVALVAAVVLAGTLCTTSKAMVLTLAATLLVVTVVLCFARRSRAIFGVLIALLVGMVTVGIVYKYTPYLDSLVTRLGDLGSEDSSVVMTGRSYQWEAAFEILFANPLNFFFGVGIGLYQTAANAYGFYTISYSVHNTMLSFLVECGVGQFLLLLGTMLYLAVVLIARTVKSRNAFYPCALWGVVAIAIFMNSLNFQNNRMSYVFLAFVAASACRFRLNKTDTLG